MFSEILEKRLTKSGGIFRIGGDEFIIMQSNVREPGEVVHMASRILESFRQACIMEGREFYISASIGISVYPDDGQDIQTLMKNADVAMYKAKETGRNKRPRTLEAGTTALYQFAFHAPQRLILQVLVPPRDAPRLFLL